MTRVGSQRHSKKKRKKKKKHYTVSQSTRTANNQTNFVASLNNAIRTSEDILKALDTPAMVHTLLNYAQDLRVSYAITRCGRFRVYIIELCELR